MCVYGCPRHSQSEHNYCIFTLGLLHKSHLDVVVNELATITGKCESLGKQLGMRDRQLHVIRTQYSNPADCLRGLISQWLQYNHLHTWSHLVHALKSPNSGEAQLGDYLKQKYIPGELSDILLPALFAHNLGNQIIK